jgi:hypothetical protein
MSDEQLVSKEEIAAWVKEANEERKDAIRRNAEIFAARHRSRLDENGAETLDPTPAEVPIGHERPPTLQEQIARLLVKPAIKEDDSLMDDDDEFSVITPYEEVFDPILGRDVSAREFEDNRDAYQALYEQSTAALSLDELRAALAVEQPVDPATEPAQS